MRLTEGTKKTKIDDFYYDEHGNDITDQFDPLAEENYKSEQTENMLNDLFDHSVKPTESKNHTDTYDYFLNVEERRLKEALKERR